MYVRLSIRPYVSVSLTSVFLVLSSDYEPSESYSCRRPVAGRYLALDVEIPKFNNPLEPGIHNIR